MRPARPEGWALVAFGVLMILVALIRLAWEVGWWLW